MFSTSSTDVRSSESSSTSGAELATGSLAAERSVRTTTNSWSVVPPFLMRNVTGPAGAFMLPRSILNSDSVAATVVAFPDPDGLAAVVAATDPGMAADDVAGADVAAAEPPPALLQPMINAPAAVTTTA